MKFGENNYLARKSFSQNFMRIGQKCRFSICGQFFECVLFFLFRLYFLERNSFFSNNTGKSREERIFELLHRRFDPPVNSYSQFSQSGRILLCISTWHSRGQYMTLKSHSSLLVPTILEQNIFFSVKYFSVGI